MSADQPINYGLSAGHSKPAWGHEPVGKTKLFFVRIELGLSVAVFRGLFFILSSACFSWSRVLVAATTFSDLLLLLFLCGFFGFFLGGHVGAPRRLKKNLARRAQAIQSTRRTSPR
jgi:hypothetical protein